MSTPSEPTAAAATGPKTVVGVVTSDKMQKTRAVKVARLEKHPRYAKYIRRHTTFYMHDEKEESHLGDTVRIVETRPLSKTKRWRLLEIVTRSRYGAAPPVSEISDEKGGGA